MAVPRTRKLVQDKSGGTRSIADVCREPSTWAGLFTIGSAVLTGGFSTLFAPEMLTQVATGFALILTKETQ